MKRYIEIVYDNSASMNGRIGNKIKYELAQELFEKEILPTIGFKGDHVVLRLLRKGCEDSVSHSEVLSNQANQRGLMLNKIKGIKHDQSTPLFYTVYDAVEACRNVRAEEYLIFVLTDGDDTCGVKIEDLVSEDILRKVVRFYDKFLLVQFAVDSSISRNNLTAFTNALGGQSISLDSSESILQMRKKLKVALNASGFSNKFPLEHCFENLPGFDMTWDDVESSGINIHQAILLYEKGLLAWEPNWNKDITSLQFAELRFLFSLLIKSSIPEDLVKTMLSQLKKPYYYSHDCIYFDFATARWKYFIPQNKIQQVPNPDAIREDNLFDSREDDFDNSEKYKDHQLYAVDLAKYSERLFVLRPFNGDYRDFKVLKRGDLVRFELK